MDNDEQIEPGQLITWLPKSCMQCYNCTILGDQSKCERRIGYGGWVSASQHPYLVGGFAEYVWLLPESDGIKPQYQQREFSVAERSFDDFMIGATRTAPASAAKKS